MLVKYRGRSTDEYCPAKQEGWVFRGGGKIGIFMINSKECKECEYHKNHVEKQKSGYVECSHPKLAEARDGV